MVSSKSTQTKPSKPSKPSNSRNVVATHSPANGHLPTAPSLSQKDASLAAHSTARMNSLGVELRRGRKDHKNQALMEKYLLNNDPLNLDDPIPQSLCDDNEHGFWELPPSDRRNFGLLVLLYFMQGIPMGLATGSVPFLLKDHMSYGEIGVFSLAGYPYSLKLLWSPIVDAVWSPKVGRRKSWILPIQCISGLGMLWLSTMMQAMMDGAGKPGALTVWNFTGWWFLLVMMCATQDIAVDGWALTLLTPGNVSYASTAQTVGLTAGQFLSYTVFLAFNSADFANKYFRSADAAQPVGLLSLSGYLRFWGWTYLAVTAVLALFKREERSYDEEGIWDVYKIMWGVLKLRNIQTILIVHLIAKIGFQANDAVTNLKLLEKGLGTDNLALTVLIDFPFEIALGYYVGMWSQRYTPMRVWSWGFIGRLVAALFAQAVVAAFPTTGVSPVYLLLVIVEHIFSTFMNTVMFVAVSAFHARISDPAIGGTYMTLLATVSNLGGTFPRYFVLRLVDVFTVATCEPPVKPLPSSSSAFLPVTTPFSCAVQADQDRCVAGGGTCVVYRDGYYLINLLCVAFGATTFLLYIWPKVLHLQDLPMRAWRLGPTTTAAGTRGGNR